MAHFVEELNHEHGKDVDGLDAETLASLRACGWPENLRELRDAIERAVVTREQGRISSTIFREELYEVKPQRRSVCRPRLAGHWSRWSRN